MDTSTLPSAASALTALDGFQMPDSATVLGQAQTKYGVQDLAGKVANLNSLTGNLTNAIAAVDPSVTGRTAGTLTTEGQRSALVARERAPVVQQLGTANDALTTAKDEYSTADTNSRNEANMTINDNQTKYQRLKDTYDTANAREEAARQATEQAARDAESKREFDISSAQNQQKITQSGSSAGSKAATPSSQQRSSDKGFNFQDASGNTVSARLYAQLTGTNFNTLLKKMAAAGDKGAADILKNGGSSKYYKSLTWD